MNERTKKAKKKLYTQKQHSQVFQVAEVHKHTANGIGCVSRLLLYMYFRCASTLYRTFARGAITRYIIVWYTCAIRYISEIHSFAFTVEIVHASNHFWRHIHSIQENHLFPVAMLSTGNDRSWAFYGMKVFILLQAKYNLVNPAWIFGCIFDGSWINEVKTGSMFEFSHEIECWNNDSEFQR